MKRILSVWLLLVFVICGKASFGQTADIAQGCEPLTVQFTAPAGSPGFFWNFGDGATAAIENPENTFTDPGTYVVEFSNSQGGALVGTVTINVYPQPVPEFTASPTSGCVPLNVSFDDITEIGQGIVINGYTWVFGDGGIASGSSPNHFFTTPGSHFVSLEIQTNMPSCNTTMVYPDAIIVTSGPNTNFTTNPNPAVACDPPLDVSFTNNSGSASPLTFEWDFGNGNTSTDENPGQETYSQNGNFIITLTATDTSGCASTYSRPVNIGSPTTDFIIPDTICLGDSVQMQNLSSVGFSTWQFVIGNSPVISTLENPWVHFDVAGLQDVTLTTSSGQCSSSLTVEIFVEDPSAEFTSTPDYSCVEPMDMQFTAAIQGYAEYHWLFGDSIESTLTNPQHEYVYDDTTIYSWYGLDELETQLIVVSSAGCKDTVLHVDTLWLR